MILWGINQQFYGDYIAGWNIPHVQVRKNTSTQSGAPIFQVSAMLPECNILVGGFNPFEKY